MENPWNAGSEAQKQWIEKWNKEYQLCQQCEKQLKCNAIDRMDLTICLIKQGRS